MTDALHYPGDCTNFDPDGVLGPDMFGACYRAASAAYDAQTDRTTLTLAVIPPSELAKLATEQQRKIFDEEATRILIETLFGTVVGA